MDAAGEGAASEAGAAPRRGYASVLLTLFAVGLALPLLDWALRLDRAAELAENRVSAPAPHRPKSWAELKQLPKAVEAYWNDAFGFRRRLIRWHALARYHLRVSPSSEVTVGRDGWLFYAGDTAADQHRGLRKLSPDDLAAWRYHLEARRDWLAARGAHLLFVIAPDKQSLYPEQLPQRFRSSAPAPADQLIDYLKARSTVDVLDLRPALREAKAEGPVYCRTDTHWNDHGTYVVYRAIMQRLARWFPRVAARPPSDFSIRQTGPWSGDLAALLGLGGVLFERDTQLAPRTAIASRTLSADGPEPETSMHFARMQVSDAAPGAPRAVVFHDSFFMTPEERRLGQPPRTWSAPRSTLQLVSLLAEPFARSAFTWQRRFDAKLVEHEQPDVVIEERVERLLILGPEDPSLPAAPK